jgi:hypothetical protein
MAMLHIVPSKPAQGSSGDKSNARHRQLIGYIGLALPWLLILFVIWRDGPTVWKGLDSVSAYYYTGANALFVGMLFVLALFLWAYEGYENRLQKWDQRFARLAALGAFCVAMFPTKAPTIAGIASVAWWDSWVGYIHFAGAFALFGSFAVFCLWLFRATEQSIAKSALERNRAPNPDQDKKLRNKFYLFCGIVIVSCLIWAGFALAHDKSIFWPEAIALSFFAASWLVKGRVLRSIEEQLPEPVRKFLPFFKSENGRSDEQDTDSRGGRH